MNMYIDSDKFLEYFNWENVNASVGTASLEVKNDNYIANLEMKSNHDKFNTYTIEFILKFQHRRYNEGTPLQKEFKIEHHPPEKSSHNKPHVQLHIHGPALENKVGEMWITLPLENEEEYNKCIEGFFHILEDVIQNCEPGLVEEMLNVNEIRKLIKQRQFLLEKINISLKENQIEFKDPNGKKIVLNSEKVKELVEKDQALLPFFE